MNRTLYNGFLELLKDGGEDGCEIRMHKGAGIGMVSCGFENF
jgi:hypothetical protein